MSYTFIIMFMLAPEFSLLILLRKVEEVRLRNEGHMKRYPQSLRRNRLHMQQTTEKFNSKNILRKKAVCGERHLGGICGFRENEEKTGDPFIWWKLGVNLCLGIGC